MKLPQRTKDYGKNTAMPDFGNGGHVDCRIGGKGSNKRAVKQGK